MQTPTPSRLRRIILPISLALNVLVIGLILGAILNGPDGRNPRAVDLSLGPLTRALSEDDRRAIGQTIRAEIARGDRPSPQTRSARGGELAKMLELLRADPFDAAAFTELLARQRARADNWAQAGTDALSARLSAMPAEERAAFADRLERELRSRERFAPGRHRPEHRR